MKLTDLLQREFVYISYYFMVQLRQIAFYGALGMVIGSLVSVFAKDAVHNCFERLRDKKWGVWGVIPASLLGIAPPLCMYGTIPIAASFSRHGMRHDWLAAFMMTAYGGDNRRAALCMWRRNDSAFAAVAGFGDEHGECSSFYDHRACHKDNQFCDLRGSVKRKEENGFSPYSLLRLARFFLLPEYRIMNSEKSN